MRVVFVAVNIMRRREFYDETKKITEAKPGPGVPNNFILYYNLLEAK